MNNCLKVIFPAKRELTSLDGSFPPGQLSQERAQLVCPDLRVGDSEVAVAYVPTGRYNQPSRGKARDRLLGDTTASTAA